MNAQTLRVIKRLESHGFPTVLATELINVLNGTALPPDQMTALVKSLQSHGYTEQMVYDLFLLFNEGTFTQLEINKLAKKFLLVGYNPVIINELVNLHEAAVTTFSVTSDMQQCTNIGTGTTISFFVNILAGTTRVQLQYNTPFGWQTIPTIYDGLTVGENVLNLSLGQTQAGTQETEVRFVDVDNALVISDVYNLAVYGCAMVAGIHINLVVGQYCDIQTGILTIQINQTNGGLDNLFPMSFEVYDEGKGWNSIGTTNQKVGTIQFQLNGYYGQTKTVRLRCGTVISDNTISVAIENCVANPAIIILESITTSNITGTEFVWSATQAYFVNEVIDIGNFSIWECITEDGNYTLVVDWNPYNVPANEPINEKNVSAHIGYQLVNSYFYKLGCLNSQGTPILSTAVRYSNTSIIINSILENGNVDADYVNAYEVAAIRQVERQSSPDNVLWATQGNFTGLASSPFTGNFPADSGADFINGNYYRLGVKDVIGNIIYSNSIQYL